MSQQRHARRTRSRRLLAAAVAAALVTAASCGGGEDEVVLPEPSVLAATTSPTTAPVTTTTVRATTTTAAATTTTTIPALAYVPPVDGGPAVRLLVIGDSLTGGGIAGQALGAEAVSYRGHLSTLLRTAGFTNVDFVGTLSWPSPADATADPESDPDHDGHGGYSIGPDDSTLYEGGPIANVDAEIDDWLAATDPDVIVVMLGLNDMFPTTERDATGKLRDLEPADAPAKYEALIARIETLAPGVDLLLASYPDIGYLRGYDPWEQLMDTTEALGVERADDRRWYVPVREWTAQTFTAEDWVTDDTHVSTTGAAKIAEAVFASLAEVISPTA
jgi:lysophospholipase L1-like esterase